jgi:predicted phosphoadenosine phosphosulfate sulfurtransferase
MEEGKKMNIQGTMKSLLVDEEFVVSKKNHVPSYVRWCATKLKEDKDMCFRVSVKDDDITVVRLK